MTGGIIFVACNHKRAHEIFIETIYHYGTSDQLLAFPTAAINMTDYFRLFETLPPGIEMGINAVLDPATLGIPYQRATRPTTAYGEFSVIMFNTYMFGTVPDLYLVLSTPQKTKVV